MVYTITEGKFPKKPNYGNYISLDKNEFITIGEDEIDCFFEISERCYHIKNNFEGCIGTRCKY